MEILLSTPNPHDPLAELNLNLALLQKEVKGVRDDLTETRREHRDIAARQVTLERRLDVLTGAIENLNKQMADMILGTRNRIDTMDTQAELLENRVAALELADKEATAARLAIISFEKQHHQAQSRWNLIIQTVTMIGMFILAYLTLKK